MAANLCSFNAFSSSTKDSLVLKKIDAFLPSILGIYITILFESWPRFDLSKTSSFVTSKAFHAETDENCTFLFTQWKISYPKYLLSSKSIYTIHHFKWFVYTSETNRLFLLHFSMYKYERENMVREKKQKNLEVEIKTLLQTCCWFVSQSKSSQTQRINKKARRIKNKIK